MKKYSKVMLCAIFTVLIAGSIQSSSSDDSLEPDKLCYIGHCPSYDAINEGYKLHLQMIIRNADGQLVTVIESTTTTLLPTYIPNGVADPELVDISIETKLQDKYLVVITDNTKYEKVQWVTKPKLGSETGILKSGMMAGVKLPSRIVLSLCADYEEYGRQCIPSFEAKLPQYYLEDDDVTTSQWTILRELD